MTSKAAVELEELRASLEGRATQEAAKAAAAAANLTVKELESKVRCSETSYWLRKSPEKFGPIVIMIVSYFRCNELEFILQGSASIKPS